MSRFRIVVTDDRYGGNYAIERKVLQEIDAALEVHDLRSDEEAAGVLKGADGVLVNLYPMRASTIEQLDRCRVLSRYGVGYDNVDIDAATKKGIWVTRVPDYSLEDVSDHAVALLLAAVRKVTFRDRSIREGRWNLPPRQPSYRTNGKVLGIIGFGAIGRTLARKMSGFGLSRVLIHDPYVDAKAAREAGVISVDLETLLRESDFVSLHAALTPQTRHLLDTTTLALMKPTAILVNTSRGPLVKEAALADALASDRLAGAGLDVFEEEPLPMESPLRQLDNVILSDHAGWYTEESVVELKTKAARNIVEVLNGEAPTYPVNRL